MAPVGKSNTTRGEHLVITHLDRRRVIAKPPTFSALMDRACAIFDFTASNKKVCAYLANFTLPSGAVVEVELDPPAYGVVKNGDEIEWRVFDCTAEEARDFVGYGADARPQYLGCARWFYVDNDNDGVAGGGGGGYGDADADADGAVREEREQEEDAAYSRIASNGSAAAPAAVFPGEEETVLWNPPQWVVPAAEVEGGGNTNKVTPDNPKRPRQEPKEPDSGSSWGVGHVHTVDDDDAFGGPLLPFCPYPGDFVVTAPRRASRLPVPVQRLRHDELQEGREDVNE